MALPNKKCDWSKELSRASRRKRISRGERRRLALESLEVRQVLSASLPLNDLTWTSLGPEPILNGETPGNASVVGRIVAIAPRPIDTNIIYAASAGGGVWKSVDGGLDWTPLTDRQPSLTMGAIAIAPSQPDTIYAGTGNAANSDSSSYGRGILKSTDGGASWSLLPGNAGLNEFDRRAVAQIVVHPTDPATVYVAVSGNAANGLTGNAGVWKTANGGTTWTNTTAAAGLTSSDTYSDLVIDPNSPNTLYTAIGTANGSGANGVYKTTDGGATWAPAGDFPQGLADANVGRIRLTLARSAPGILYASVINDRDVPAAAGDGSLYKLLKSTDEGGTWTELVGVPNFAGDTGWYAAAIAVSPSNPDEVFAGGGGGFNSVIHSADGGITWNNLSVGFNGIGPHASHHGFAFDASGRLFDANSGGLWRLNNATTGSVEWTNLTADLAAGQFIGIALHPTSADIAYGAAPENGTNRFADNKQWAHLADGSGGSVRIDRVNPSTLYRTVKYGAGFIQRSDDSGGTWAMKTSGINSADPANSFPPLVMDPVLATRLLTGTDRVYESTNRAETWTSISIPLSNGWTSTANIDAIAAAPNDLDTIYAAAGDTIFATFDRGATWNLRSLPIAGQIGDLIVDPANTQKIWATRRVFGGGHIWHSMNGGTTWTDISGDLPDNPVLSIELDARPANDVLYAGTDMGVYASTGDNGRWVRFGEGLPNVQVADLELNPTLNILAAGTNGRGLWQMLAAPTPDLYEPNQTRNSAQELGVIPGIHLEQVSLHPIGATVDDDWYQVELLRPDNLEFTANFSRALADVTLQVTDVNGISLGTASSGTSDQESLSLSGLAAGTYFIRVTSDGPIHYDLAVTPGLGSTTRVFYVNDVASVNDVYTTSIGNDANDGLSPHSPKATLQSVINEYDLGATDLVVIDTGSYFSDGFLTVADQGVAIAGSAAGSRLMASTSILLVDADLNTLYSLQFTGGGIFAQGDGVNDSTNNTFRRNRFTDSSPAIQISHGSSDLISENTIEGTGFLGVFLPSGGDVTLRHNTISNRTKAVFASGSAALTIDEGNQFLNNQDAIHLTDGTADISGSDFASNTRGIFAASSVTSVSIHGNEFDANETAIRSETTGAVVFNNDIHDNTVVGISGVGIFGATDWQSGDANEVFDNRIGIQPESGATVRYNRIHHNTVGIRVDAQLDWSPIDIHHNTIYRNTDRGIHISRAASTTIVNNTVYATGTNADAIRIDGSSNSITHRNNILWTDGGYDLWVATDSQQGFSSDFNNLFTSGNGKLVHWQKDFVDLFDWQVEAGFDGQSIGYTALDPTLDNPTFVNLAGDDFHLVDGVSTSIDAADPTSLFALEPAPNGNRADLGAYGNTSEAAESRLSYLEVDRPNYYTDWEQAESGAILWHSVNLTGAVDIDLYSDSGVFLSRIATTDVSTGAIAWNPAASGIAGEITKRYRIRITSQSNTAISDQSREPFSVPPPVHDFTADNNDDYYVNDGLTTNDEYTSAIGNNRNTGTSPADPKAVLFALLRAYDLGPGTTVHIDTGNYGHVRNVVISGDSGVDNDEGLTLTGPTDLSRVAQIDRDNPFSGTTGLELFDGDFVTVRNLTFRGAEIGMWVRSGSTNLLGENLTFVANASDGLRVEADSENTSLDRLTSFNNGGHGIAILTGIESLTRSTARHNAGTGILLQTTEDTRLENNEVFNNALGISLTYLASGSPAVVGNADLTLGRGNRVHDNSAGILATGNVLIAGNTVHDNVGDGIQLVGAAALRNVVFNNAAGIV